VTAKFIPTPEQRQRVAAWVAAGIPHDTICRLVAKDGTPITGKTLRKAFRAEIDSGGAEANAEITNSMFAKAIAGDATLMIWWTKTRMGWRETIVNANLNVPADSRISDEITRQLLPELAACRTTEAPSEADAGQANGSAVLVGMVGPAGAARTNGHG
jgi:hypothetical protein